MVSHDPFLFNGSIAENISYSKPDALPHEIIAAAKAANAHNFILRFPDGYDTIVGERGARVSGGERQRISIARAILKNPSILILDEATSSIDIKTEEKIINSIIKNFKLTLIIVSHRKNLQKFSNKVFNLIK